MNIARESLEFTKIPKPSEPSALLFLPDETLVKICDYLNARESRMLSGTCRGLRRVRDLLRETRCVQESRVMYCDEMHPGGLVRLREVLWFPNVRRVVGPCHVPNGKGLREFVRLQRAIDLEITWTGPFNRNIVVIMDRCLAYPQCSLVVYTHKFKNILKNQEIFRYDREHLHLTVDSLTRDLDVRLCSRARALNFSSLCLTVRNLMHLDAETSRREIGSYLRALDTGNKEIRVLEIGEWPCCIHPSAFPHLHTLRFLSSTPVDATTVFTEPAPTVTHMVMPTPRPSQLTTTRSSRKVFVSGPKTSRVCTPIFRPGT